LSSLVKSGTDFRDLSEIFLELYDPPEPTIRRKVIKSMTGDVVHFRPPSGKQIVFFFLDPGRRHSVTPGMPSSEPLAKLLSTLLEDVSLSLSAPLCFALEEWDVRSEVVRTDEVRETSFSQLCVSG
jgi:5'-nucleotidase